MTRKSAASAKPKAVKAPKLTDEEKWKQMEQVFEDAKWTYIETVRVQVKAAKRVDNYLNIRELIEKMTGEKPTVQRVKDMQKISVQTYEKVQEIAEGFKMEDFVHETCPDPFEDIMPQVNDISVDVDEIIACIKFMSITPYGNNLIQMHNLMMQELSARQLKPKE